MNLLIRRRLVRRLAMFVFLAAIPGLGAQAQSTTTAPSSPSAATATPKEKEPPKTLAAPATPETKVSPSATPPAPAPPTPAAPAPAAKTPGADKMAPEGKAGNTEIEPNGSPGIPDNATTENVDVPSRPALMVGGQSTYDEAFKSIKASIDAAKKAMDKAGLKPTGHPITIFSEPDDKGFKYRVAIPLAAKPEGKPDIGADATIDVTPAGKAIKFQHRGAYEDIDSTYDVITAYLDAKGLQVDNPYIEEYLTELTAADDPNLQVDIYVFVK